MAAISTNAEYMQHCVVKYWTRLSQRCIFPGILHLRGKGHSSQDFYLPLMVCIAAKFNGAHTRHDNKHSERSRQPRTIAKLSAT